MSDIALKKEKREATLHLKNVGYQPGIGLICKFDIELDDGTKDEGFMPFKFEGGSISTELPDGFDQDKIVTIA